MISIARPNPSNESFEVVARASLCWVNHVTELCKRFEVASRMRCVPRFVHRERKDHVQAVAWRSSGLLPPRRDTQSPTNLKGACTLNDVASGKESSRVY